MPVAYVADTSGSALFSDTVGMTDPGSAPGDVVLFAWVALGDFDVTETITPPGGGYTLIYEAEDGTSGNGIRVWSHVAGGSEPGTHTFSSDVEHTFNIWATVAYSGVDTVGDLQATISLGDTWTAPSVDVDSDDSMVVTLVTATSPVADAGQTQRVDQDVAFSNTRLLIADDAEDTGASGTRSGACTFQSWWAVNVALESGGGGGTTTSTDVDSMDVSVVLDPVQLLPNLAIVPLVPGDWRDLTPAGFTASPDDPFTQGMAVAPSDQRILYLAVISTDDTAPVCGVYKSYNGGGNWAQVSGPGIGGPGQPIKIVVDPADPGHVLVCDGVRGSSMGVWITDDGGETWAHEVMAVGLSDVYAIVADPSDFDHLLVSYHSPWDGVDEGGFSRSTDGGDTWTDVPVTEITGGFGWGIHFLYHPASGTGNASTLLICTQGSGIWRSTNAGVSWTQVSTVDMAHGGSQLVYAPNGSACYLTSESDILRSTNNGASWTPIGPNTAGFLGVATDGTSLFTERKGGGELTQRALLSADTSWSSFGTETFTDPGVTGGAFEMHWSAIYSRLYTASQKSGFWAFSFQGAGTAAVPPALFFGTNF